MEGGERRIAVACQGGGAFTAYTAGVLRELLAEVPEQIVALSGTSGGAICALLAWQGLLHDDPERGREDLAAFWADVAADSPPDALLNAATVGYVALESTGWMLPELSPQYNPYSWYAKDRLRALLERYVEFSSLEGLLDASSPRLFVGAVNITSSAFTVFHGSGVSADAVLASAALPLLFSPVEIDGEYYWDGLLSENPPIRPLHDVDPDELWIVQTNTQRTARPPRSLGEIIDRRNELAGNLSLNQELQFVESLNELAETGALDPDEYSPVDVHRLTMGRDPDYASKFDRDPAFIDDLLTHGEGTAREFLAERAAE